MYFTRIGKNPKYARQQLRVSADSPLNKSELGSPTRKLDDGEMSAVTPNQNFNRNTAMNMTLQEAPSTEAPDRGSETPVQQSLSARKKRGKKKSPRNVNKFGYETNYLTIDYHVVSGREGGHRQKSAVHRAQRPPEQYVQVCLWSDEARAIA